MNFKPIQEKLIDPKDRPLGDKVLARIEHEAIKPAPRWRFKCIDYGIWILWALSVIAGAVAFTVMLYVFSHAWFSLFEATHDTALSFFVEVLPYIWIISFVGLVLVSYVNLRHTKHGYRFPFWQIVLSSVIFSFVGGVALHYLGVGYLIDTTIGRTMPSYPSLERAEMKMWQMPEEGRLVGVFTDEEEEMLYSFSDAHGDDWKIDITELRAPDRSLLESGISVRVLGTTTVLTDRRFHACGVFPWMYEKNIDLKKMSEAKAEFIEQMHKHMEVSERFEKLEHLVMGEGADVDDVAHAKPFMESTCAKLDVVRRIKQREFATP